LPSVGILHLESCWTVMEISFQLDQKNILIKVSHPFFDAACNSFSVYVQFQV
jgi:hypothetical protein